jgi:hypothetical protein
LLSLPSAAFVRLVKSEEISFGSPWVWVWRMEKQGRMALNEDLGTSEPPWCDGFFYRLVE